MLHAKGVEIAVLTIEIDDVRSHPILVLTHSYHAIVIHVSPFSVRLPGSSPEK